jgi:lysophospholipase L1-like esterase
MTDPWPDITLRFHHPEKSSELTRLHATEADLAPLVARELGISVGELARLRRRLADSAEVGALEVAAQPGFVDAVRALPFDEGDTVVILGDSVSDDALSWANQLATVVGAVIPERAVRIVNGGRSGDTTAAVIDRLDSVIELRPEWVLQLLGTNDARRHGLGRHQVFAPAETARNFATIAAMLQETCDPRLVRMTPPPLLPRRIDDWSPFTMQRLSWRDEDVRRIGLDLLQVDPTAIDLYSAMIDDAESLIGEDGLHPNLVGQQRILERVVQVLSVR